MNREILFRGKAVIGSEWIYGGYTYDDADKDHMITQMNDDGMVIGYVVDPSTIGQYTGLTDKNGVKIWEGDIVSTTWGNVNGDGIILWSVDEAMFKIKWITRIFKEIRGQSQNYTKDGEPILRNHSITLRVVGAIHDTHLNKQS